MSIFPQSSFGNNKVHPSGAEGGDIMRAGTISRRPKLGNGMPVSSPMLCAVLPDVSNPGKMGYWPLPTSRFAINAKCQISMGFVDMEIHCEFPQGLTAAPLQLVLPKTSSTTVTQLVVENTVRDSVYVTAVVPLEDVQKKGYKAQAPPPGYPGAAQQQQQQQGGAEEPDPELYTLFLPSQAQPGDRFKISLSYFHPLEFVGGSYVLVLPTEMQQLAVPAGRQAFDVLDITLTINTGTTAPVQFSSQSGHVLCKGLDTPGMVTLSLDKGPQAVPNTDVMVGYEVWGKDVMVSLHVTPPRQPSPGDPDPRGTFLVSVSPPSPEATRSAPRSVVFILDRSGSMYGEPMDSAKAALLFGLRLLGPEDEFAVVAFDHEQAWFNQQLLPAEPQHLTSCSDWINNYVSARGLTNIHDPLHTALNMLGGAKGLPSVFLITDGCVDNEREICQTVAQITQAQQMNPAALQQGGIPRGLPRITTFAIGQYANHYFLKQLATYGRGIFDVAFRPHSIQAQMQRMLVAAQKPVLSDITLGMQGLTSCELYPFPIPDLCCGTPLLVAGKFEGKFPDTITIHGTLPGGQPWQSHPISISKEAGLPLDKIFIKTRMDIMTAQAWLANNPPHMVEPVVNLSVATGVPCPYTRTVGFETTRANYQQYVQQQQSRGPSKANIAALAIGGVAGIAVIAGVGAALAFGDVGATIANTGVFDAFGGLAGGLGDVGGCCADCGDCGDCADCADCDIGECADVAGAGCVIS